MTMFHEFRPDQIAALARGDGGPAAIAALRSAQLSRHLLLVRHLLRQWPGDPQERDAIAETLGRAQAEAPESFAKVLGAPLVGAWTGIAVRAVERGVAAPSDYGQLGAIAAVAAAAAGIPADLAVPVRGGVLSVPGLGALNVGETTSTRLVADGECLKAIVDGRSFTLLPGGDEPGWFAVRRLAAYGAPGVALDDVDPYRHGHHCPPASRLSDADVVQWQRLFAAAWELLARHLPERAAELATGLETLIPLVQADSRTARSATIRHAFGAFGLTLPPSAAEFVVTLVHEFQHSKLSGMLDLAQMSDPGDARRFFAPWRADPRPIAGLLQGVYAFVGVADAWRALRAADDLAEVATAKYAEARLQVDRGLASLEASGALTETGDLVIAGLRARTDEMLAEPLDAKVVREAQRSLDETHRRWTGQNAAVQSAAVG